MPNIARNAIELVGRTELVRLNRVTEGALATVVAKMESQNPGGSVKHRIGVSMIEDAERRGLIKPGRTVIVMSLDLKDGTLAAIAAFYAIVNIPKAFLPLVFREMERVLQPGGILLLAFHTGNEVLHEEELWGRSICMDFFLFQPSEIRRYLEAAGLVVEETIERGPYAPEVEYQSHRAYIFARKRVG